MINDPFHSDRITKHNNGMTRDDFARAGLVGTCKKLFREEGLMGVFSWNKGTILSGIARSNIVFFAFDRYRYLIQNKYPSLMSDATVDLIAGTSASFTSFAFTVNITSIKGRVHCMLKIYQEFGLKGLYQGIGPTVVAFSILTWVKFLAFEGMKGNLPQKYNKVDTAILGCGVVAGIAPQTITYLIKALKAKIRSLLQVFNIRIIFDLKIILLDDILLNFTLVIVMKARTGHYNGNDQIL
ncbi:hypothetical protein LXL04_017816 [Taraxacum kok-saghyz]